MVDMACSVTFLLVRRLLDLIRLGPAPDEKDEIAVLRHPVAVYAVRSLGLATPPLTAPSWPLWPCCSAVTGGGSSSLRRRRCCAGTGNSELVCGPIVPAVARRPKCSWVRRVVAPDGARGTTAEVR